MQNRIRTIRKMRKLSQLRLAEAVGCSNVQISDLEKGNVQLTLNWMRRIAAALAVDPADLLVEDDNPYILTEPEKILIDIYRAATQDTRLQILAAVSAIANPGKPLPALLSAAA